MDHQLAILIPTSIWIYLLKNVIFYQKINQLVIKNEFWKAINMEKRGKEKGEISLSLRSTLHVHLLAD